MDYNQFSIPKFEKFYEENKDKQICPRAKLDTGTFCNYNCTFCYYKNRLDIIDSYENIIKRLEYIKQYKIITEIELSGGESSIHPDWFKLLEECSKYYNHISTLSNGYNFAKESFLQKSKANGLKEILFSVHGYGKYHDEITNRKGSFEIIKTAINNALNNDIITRINCTVTNSNKDCLIEEYSNYILELISKGLKQLNFIFSNYWSDNNEGEIINYTSLGLILNKVLEKILFYYPLFDIRLRYVPYCFIDKRFHNLIYGQFQHIFDLTDWNKEIYDNTPVKKDYKLIENFQMAYDSAKKTRKLTYTKDKDCLQCSKFFDCDGIEKELKSTQEVYVLKKE